MTRKTLFLSFALVGLLGFRNPVPAVPPEAAGLFCPQGGIVAPTLVKSAGPEGRSSLALDRSKAGRNYENLEKSLQQLLEEMESLRKDMKKRWNQEVVPRLEKEIEKLRKWLYQFRMKEDDREPIRT